MSGINAVPFVKARKILAARRATTKSSTSGFTFRDTLNSFSYAFTIPPKILPSLRCLSLTRILDDMAGTTVSAITRLANSE